MTRRLIWLAVAVWAGGALAAGTVAEPDGYRMQDYRAPVPGTLHGGTVITVAEARLLWEQHAAVFVDVLPRAPKPADLPAETVWQPKPNNDIPGSIWLPDVGYGELAPVTLRYFTENLARATGGDKDRALVFYCLPSCWHSWNAAKRAVSLGYRHADWMPEGVEGWKAAGYALEAREPAP
jgi:PQQ-dependent catabolism-associated CXXCW motif protein